MQRQSRDPYSKQRQQERYRSRAAYKLMELNRREQLIRSNSQVIDLGAAPGGWTQVATQLVGRNGRVVALDLLKVGAVPGATIIQGDCLDEAVREQVRDILAGASVDLVMSDMAPNITGIGARDEAAAAELARIALTFAQAFLRPGGAMLIKLFQFAETDAVVDEINRVFGKIVRRKPLASRAQSREFYVVAKQFGL